MNAVINDIIYEYNKYFFVIMKIMPNKIIKTKLENVDNTLILDNKAPSYFIKFTITPIPLEIKPAIKREIAKNLSNLFVSIYNSIIPLLRLQ